MERNNSNQLGELAEILSEYEMLRHYNPFYFDWLLYNLHEDKHDLYHKSVGLTDFDDVQGIKLRGLSVEIIGEKLVGIDEQIERLKKEHDHYSRVLQAHTCEWKGGDLNDLRKYFRHQMRGEFIEFKKIEDLKRELYHVELKERNERIKQIQENEVIESIAVHPITI